MRFRRSLFFIVHQSLTLAVTGRSEQREPRSGGLRCYATTSRVHGKGSILPGG